MSRTTTTSVWRAADLARIRPSAVSATPVIRAADIVPMVAGWDVWDVGPVLTPMGQVASIGGSEIWLVLCASAVGDPGARHDRARLRLVARTAETWRDLGELFPNGASLGSREWAGSAVYDEARETLDVLYTAVGGRDGSRPNFLQRIVSTSARVVGTRKDVRLEDWSAHREILSADGELYESTEADHGEPGFIKAFRDPHPFRDPADGREWLLFTGSKAHARTAFNGAVGLAERDLDDSYRLEPPLLEADGVNNELERPHLIAREGRYYLFFSTQHRTFAPKATGPTGLYGFVAQTFRGPYEPINGSGLVLRNPDEEPFQAYSWLVLPDLSVASFVDAHSLAGRPFEEITAAGPDAVRDHFGGTIAPILHLDLDGAKASIRR